MNEKQYYQIEADKARSLYFKVDGILESLPHFHDSVEFIIPINGKIECFVNGQSSVLGKDDIFFVNSYESHYYQPRTAKISAIVLVISRNYLSEFYRNYPNSNFPHFMIDKEKNKPIIEYLINWHKSDKKTDLFNQGSINIFLSMLVDAYKLGKNTKEVISDVLLKDILVYIHEHYLEDISLTSLADALGYTIEHCSKTLKKATNCNFRIYLNSLRIRRVEELINDKSINMSKTQILHQCGFVSSATYYRVKKAIEKKHI